MQPEERLQLAMALHGEGRCVESLATIEELLKEERPLTNEQEALAWRMRARITAQDLKQPGPVPVMYADRSMRAARGMADRELFARCAVDAAMVAIFACDLNRAAGWLAEVNPAELSPDPAWRIHHNRGWIAYLQQNYGQALEETQHAAKLAPEALDPAIVMALTHIALNRPGAALEALDKLDKACPPDDTYHAGRIAWATGWALLIGGYNQEAADRMSAAVAYANMGGDVELLARIHATLAAIAGSNGDTQEAHKMAWTAQALAEKAGRLDLYDLCTNLMSPWIDRQALAAWREEA